VASGIDAVVSGSSGAEFPEATAVVDTTSTSMACGTGCRVAPGPGKVISIGSRAATQTACTAPAASTQSGRVIERRSVKVRLFQGALAHAFALLNPHN
jgi:hypothetical protein